MKEKLFVTMFKDAFTPNQLFVSHKTQTKKNGVTVSGVRCKTFYDIFTRVDGSHRDGIRCLRLLGGWLTETLGKGGKEELRDRMKW